MDDTPIKDVSDTAFMVAMYRAMESRRSDALFHDPLAAKLAGEHGRRILEGLAANARSRRRSIRAAVLGWTMALRTRIIDDFILASIAQGTDAVVNLGAGLDTRPYRMALPETLQWIEVDYPHVIELKNERLADEQPRCRLERVKLDLADVPERRQLFAGIDARFKQALVLTEGVILYLTEQAVAALADDLNSRPCFRQWIADYVSPQVMRFRKHPSIQRQMANAPFRFEPKDYFRFFAEHGWAPSATRYLWDEGQRLKRPLPLPRIAKLLIASRVLFMSREQLAARRRFMAYVLFERQAAA